jgi:hypothetical protein
MNTSRTPADPSEFDGVYDALRPLMLSIVYEMVGAINSRVQIVSPPPDQDSPKDRA